jgi:hypothetical protein
MRVARPRSPHGIVGGTSIVKSTSVQDAVRWTLSAWMLLATSISSTTFAHDHTSGQLAQQHRGCDHRLSGSLTAKCLLDGQNGSGSEPTVPRDESPCNWCCWIAAVSAAQVVRAPSQDRVIDRLGPTFGALIATTRTADSLRCEVPSADAAPSSPLCDRARHERSGVQLA